MDGRGYKIFQFGQIGSFLSTSSSQPRLHSGFHIVFICFGAYYGSGVIAERPIAFFSRAIRDVALKYNIIEKQALALVKALKYFRVYILHSHILAYVPNTVVKNVLVQTDPEGRWGKLIAALLEYDVEIKPTKLVKGQGLAKLMAESNLHALDINLIAAMSYENEEGSPI